MKKIIVFILALFTTTFVSCIFEKNTFQKKWTIDKYNIKLYRGQGLVGPVYYFYTLDKSKFPSRLFFKARKTYVPFEKLSNCELSFNQNSETKYQFDICTNLPDPIKTLLDPHSIESIEVFRIDSISSKTIFLDSLQKCTFINDWNQSKKYTRGSPRIIYLIRVKESIVVRTFNSDGFYLYEQPEDAKYEFSDKTFFTNLFNK